MRNNKLGALATIGFTVAICAVALVQRSGAQNAAETTYLTFNRPVELPGRTLGAGTYIFELVSPMSGSGVVRVISRDRHQQYFMGFTNRVDRPRGASDGPGVSLGEAAAGASPRIQAWWPADVSGHEFIYTAH
jgi:hypothetical protein